MKTHVCAQGSLILCIILITGCTNNLGVNDQQINQDIDKYASQKFSLGNLKQGLPELKNATIKNLPVQNNKILKMNVYTSVANSNDQNYAFTSQRTYEYLGNGVVRETVQTLKNDIVSSNSFYLEYEGLVSLLTQTVSAGSNGNSPVYELKSALNVDFDLSDPDKKVSKISLTYGSLIGIPPSTNDYEVECTQDKKGDAKNLREILSGMAIEYNCKYFSNGSLSSKYKMTYLVDYGVAFVTEYISGFQRENMHIVDISIENRDIFYTN